MNPILLNDIKYDRQLIRYLENPDIADDEKTALVAGSAANNLSAKNTANRYLWVMTNLQAQADAREARAKELKRQADVINRQVEWFRHSIKTYMEMKGIDKLEMPDFTASIRSNPGALEITDESKIPGEFIEIRQEKVIKKAEIKAAMKAEGQIIREYAQIVKTTRLDIK